MAFPVYTGENAYLFITIIFSTTLTMCYRGVWALIQAQISQIDFDYSSYAENRFGEYNAWRREQDGSRAKAGEEMPLRERRWAQEA